MARNSFRLVNPIHYIARTSLETTHKLMDFYMEVYTTVYGCCFFELFPIGLKSHVLTGYATERLYVTQTDHWLYANLLATSRLPHGRRVPGRTPRRAGARTTAERRSSAAVCTADSCTSPG